jgi:pyruvate formate lyase activating enzyme
MILGSLGLQQKSLLQPKGAKRVQPFRPRISLVGRLRTTPRSNDEMRPGTLERSELTVLSHTCAKRPARQAELSAAIAAPAPLDRAERHRLEQVKGIVFDVQRYSLHDGPGLRTNIFLKGCPLECAWCANPESQRLQPELALYAHNCMTCGQFAERCPTHWQSTEGWSHAQVAAYGERVELCPTGAIHWIGVERTAGDLMAEVQRDRPFYEDGGGMTLTGGEATMQPEMALALLRLARADLINTAIETTGYTRWPVLESLLPYLNTVLYDFKHIDSSVHRRFTGVGNELILENLRKLAECGAPLVVRVPLIPGFNAAPETLQAMADFIITLGASVQAVDILPYHTLGRAKYRALGREYPWENAARLRDNEVSACVEILQRTGHRITVGG